MAGDSVGTAYLTLVPKLDSNMAPLEEDMEGAGERGGLKFSDGLKKIAKTAAVLGAGKAVADTFFAAFNGSAEFEQLKGGVDKIFDGMDTSVIMKDANEAWKTMNMSANDYLSTINDVGATFAMTMGREEGYNAAKKGLQAIADYASGTGKNVDLLSEKFTMITRSTSSYQSIADQFSGILPATSKDFLEQAQAAGILSDSYKSLTDVPIDEYQGAVSEMLESGVKDMGLYKNTVEETERTLSGSIAGMKASWSNLVTEFGVGDSDIGKYLDDFMWQFGHMAENVVDTVLVILDNVGGMIEENLPSIIEDVIGHISDNLPTILDAAVMFFLQIVEAIAMSLPKIAAAVPGIVVTIVGTLLGHVGDFVDAGMNIIQGIVAGIVSGMYNVVDAIINVCRNALDAVKSFFGIASPSKVMRKMGGYIGEGLALGIEDSESVVEEAMDGLNGLTYMGAEAIGSGGFAGGSREVISWLASNLPAIIAECTPTVGERDFARMARKAVANG